MHKRYVFCYERDDPLISIIEHIPYFGSKELEVLESSADGKSDEDIADELKISREHLEEIRNEIKNRIKEILRGY